MCHTLVTHYDYSISYNMTFYDLQTFIVMATGSVMYQFILDYVFTSYNLNYMIIIVKLTSTIAIQQVSYIIFFLMCSYKCFKKWSFQNWTNQTISYVCLCYQSPLINGNAEWIFGVD